MDKLLQEKRKYKRFNTAIKVLYRNSDTKNTAILKNISMMGMLLISSEQLSVSSVLTIVLSTPGMAGGSSLLVVKVLWTKELVNNGYLIGLEIISNFSQDTRSIINSVAPNN